MFRETLLQIAFQSGVLFLLIWAIFRLVPSIPANAKAWIWRLAFLKPIASLLPFASVPLHVLGRGAEVVIGDRSALSELPPRLHELVPATLTKSTPVHSGLDPLLILWAIGATGFAGYGLLRLLRAAILVRHAEPLRDRDLLYDLKGFSERAGLSRPVRLLASPEVQSPMLVGGWRPAILLPLEEPDSYEDLQMMLAHEVAHLARRDVVWFGLIWIVQSLFFFNPIVWLAAYAARLDHESATDREAARLAEVPIQSYGEMLLRATVVAHGSLVPGILPMAESYRSIHRRLEAMKQFKNRPSRLAQSAVVALAFGAVAVLPLYRLAEASPLQNAREQTEGTLVFSVPASTKNPFKYSVFKLRDQWWIQIEKDGSKRRYLWEDEAKPGADGTFGWVKRSPDGNSDMINAEFERYDVRQALRKAFQVVPHSYTIDPRVQGTVTAAVRNVTFETFLENLVRQVNARFRIENGVYKIFPLPAEGQP